MDPLTADNSDADVELHHVVAEGGWDHADAAQDAAHHHDGPAAVRVDQDAADGTWTPTKHSHKQSEQAGGMFTVVSSTTGDLMI